MLFFSMWTWFINFYMSKCFVGKRLSTGQHSGGNSDHLRHIRWLQQTLNYLSKTWHLWDREAPQIYTKALKRWVLHNVSLTHKRIPFSIHVQLFYITWSMLILQIVASAYCVKCQRLFVHCHLNENNRKQNSCLKAHVWRHNPFSYSPKVILAVPEQPTLISYFVLHQTVRLFSRVEKQGCR